MPGEVRHYNPKNNLNKFPKIKCKKSPKKLKKLLKLFLNAVQIREKSDKNPRNYSKKFH